MSELGKRKRRHDTLDSNKTVKAVFKKDWDNQSDSESELYIDDRPTRRKCGRIPNAEIPLPHLVCEWDQCFHSFSEYSAFIDHLNEHIFDDDDTIELQSCLWDSCDFSDHPYYLKQHLHYHGYIVNLQCKGKMIEKRQGLPPCNQEFKNVIPILRDGYLCEWENCFKTFQTIYLFHEHMKFHIYHNPKGHKEGVINCCWNACKKTNLPSQYKLGEHLRSHTNEKFIACSTCATTYANITKFADHRKRQIPIDERGYLCSHCSKYFSSEKLLKDHMRLHINHYKCTMCDMTCPKPYILAKHIRYRHSNEKPYKCTECHYNCVSHYHLQTHMASHKKENSHKCDECEYECRSAYGLERHMHKNHGKNWKTIYECHICQVQFHRGNYLTRHLMNVHNCHWPSGHSRFRYKEDPDGIYRLQTVRYETIDVIEEIMKGNSAEQDVESSSMECNLVKRIRKDMNEVQQFDVVLSSKDQDDNLKEVVITIDDLDSKGNVLKSKTIQAKEIICDD